MHLTVKQPFPHYLDGVEVGQYAKGEKIFDADEIRAVLASENASHVIKTADQMMNGTHPASTDAKKLN
jgi:hypothetical protein